MAVVFFPFEKLPQDLWWLRIVLHYHLIKFGLITLITFYFIIMFILYYIINNITT